jgi:DNA-binding transcriptional MerR regulator
VGQVESRPGEGAAVGGPEPAGAVPEPVWIPLQRDPGGADAASAPADTGASGGEPAGAQPEPPATAGSPAPAEPEPLVPLGRVAELLGLAPFLLRNLLEEFGDLVPVRAGAEGPGVAAEAMERLRVIAHGRAQGLAADEIRRRLERGPEDSPPTAAAVLERLERLQAELAVSERRRVEDRDRLLTALMRTQQEIQHLRYELAGRRRERRRGFWARLFGR